VIFTLLLVLVASSCGYIFPTVTVRVKNEASSTVTSLTIKYNGGSESIRELKAGETEKVSIRAQGDSDLEVSYDQNDEHHVARIDVYFHSLSNGQISLFIQDGGEVKVKADNLG